MINQHATGPGGGVDAASDWQPVVVPFSSRSGRIGPGPMVGSATDATTDAGDSVECRDHDLIKDRVSSTMRLDAPSDRVPSIPSLTVTIAQKFNGHLLPDA